MFIKQLQPGGPFPLCIDGEYLNCWKPPWDSTATEYFLLNPHWLSLPKSGVCVCVSFSREPIGLRGDFLPLWLVQLGEIRFSGVQENLKAISVIFIWSTWLSFVNWKKKPDCQSASRALDVHTDLRDACPRVYCCCC